MAEKNEFILIITDKGYAVRTPTEEYPVRHRGTRGVKAISTSDEKKGKPIFAKRVTDEDKSIMVITRNGMGAQISVDEIRVTGRNTSGTKLISLEENDVVISVA